MNSLLYVEKRAIIVEPAAPHMAQPVALKPGDYVIAPAPGRIEVCHYAEKATRFESFGVERPSSKYLGIFDEEYFDITQEAVCGFLEVISGGAPEKGREIGDSGFVFYTNGQPYETQLGIKDDEIVAIVFQRVAS